LKRDAFGGKFHGITLVKDTIIGTVRSFVEIDENFMCMVWFVVNEAR